MSKFCFKCGKELDDSAVFCSGCGASQQLNTTSTTDDNVSTNVNVNTNSQNPFEEAFNSGKVKGSSSNVLD